MNFIIEQRESSPTFLRGRELFWKGSEILGTIRRICSRLLYPGFIHLFFLHAHHETSELDHELPRSLVSLGVYVERNSRTFLRGWFLSGNKNNNTRALKALHSLRLRIYVCPSPAKLCQTLNAKPLSSSMPYIPSFLCVTPFPF